MFRLFRPSLSLSPSAIIYLCSRGAGYRRCFHAHHLYDGILHGDLYSLNSVLSSYVRDDNHLGAWQLFHQMRRTCSELDSYTFTPILVACSEFPDPVCGEQVHGLVIKMGMGSGAVTSTALIDMYSKLGYLDESVRVFEEMEFKDVVTWNALLSSFVREDNPQGAFSVFQAMKNAGVEFSEFTLCSVLKASASLRAFRQGKQVHGLIVVMGRDMVVLGTALVDFYSDVGCIGEAMKVYSTLKHKRDVVMLNSLITGCVQNQQYDEAFSVVSVMKPNVISLTTALAACSETSNFWVGKQIHCVAIRRGFTSNTQLCNALLDMYAKCGKMLNARSLFDAICHKDVVSWTSMIDAYGCHGQGLGAFELFMLMEEERNGVLPNSVTLLAVLSACGHSGLVEEAKECFDLAENYGLVRGLEQYACYIDILGRAGRIDDVWLVFHAMVKRGIRPTAAVWATLLNACSHNLDVKRGELAAKNLMLLEPDKPGSYVSLSNFYASVGKWDYVDKLRDVMRMKGLVKEAGNSRLTLAQR